MKINSLVLIYHFQKENLPSGTSDYILNNKKRTVCTSTDTSFIDTSISVLESTYYQINLSTSDFANLLA